MTQRDLSALIAAASGLERCEAWTGLAEQSSAIRGRRLAELLDDPERFASLTARSCGLTLDFSRNLLVDATLEELLRLAEQRDLGDWIGHLFAGSPVNNTEDRPALHMALRLPPGQPLVVAGQDVTDEVQHELDRFLALADAVRSGSLTGASGRKFTDVVNIGIGGSDLGLVMLDAALAEYRDPAIRLHFVSNIDGAQLADVLDGIDPETTLFIICSKSFATLETQLNAEAARQWFLETQSTAALGQHFAAISVNAEAMDRFGIGEALRFRIWDWVGGRYSLWSAIGLSIAIGIGSERFRELLAGAAAMDQHFSATPLKDNLPVLLGLVGIWQRNFLGATSHAVLPYDQRLEFLPAFLQQLEMESNGKGVTRDGQRVNWSTGTVIWGQPGSNAQHSFFQLLHQGTADVSLDFIAPVAASSRFPGQHLQGLGNMLAQAESFARGYTADEVRADLEAAGRAAADIDRLLPHKTHPGNRSSTILLLERLDPWHLGALIALYEHKVFVQGVIWGVNSFDQWGVERGKALATRMSAGLTGREDAAALPPIAHEIRDRSPGKP